MWLYYFTRGSWREIGEDAAADRFFEWISEDRHGSFLVLLREFVAASEHHGGLGATTESEDDLIELAEAINERIMQLR